MSAGHWVRLVAGDPAGTDRTGLGVALYDGDGKLVHHKIDSPDRAIARGDLPPSLAAMSIWVPETFAEMLKTLGRISHAMSVVRWEEPLPTLVWDEEILDDLYARTTSQKEQT